jgi:hypothetical protein
LTGQHGGFSDYNISNLTLHLSEHNAVVKFDEPNNDVPDPSFPSDEDSGDDDEPPEWFLKKFDVKRRKLC